MNVSPDKIVELRKDRGWSQEKLAAISSLSQRTIQRAEKDGTCSLDTKLALSTAFDVSPSVLSFIEVEYLPENKKLITSWSGILGLFTLGLITPIVALLTATSGEWEMTCLAVVWGMTIILTAMNYGALPTYKLFDNTSWIVKYPAKVSGLSAYIAQAKTAIEYAYIVGIVASLVSGLAIAVHVPNQLAEPVDFVVIVIRPIFYSVLFVEL